MAESISGTQLHLSKEGWPGWVGLSGLDKYRDGRHVKGCHKSQYLLGIYDVTIGKPATYAMTTMRHMCRPITSWTHPPDPFHVQINQLDILEVYMLIPTNKVLTMTTAMTTTSKSTGCPKNKLYYRITDKSY